MDSTSDWFYKSIQQRRTLSISTLASAFEINKSLEDLGLGSFESIETGEQETSRYFILLKKMEDISVIQL